MKKRILAMVLTGILLLISGCGSEKTNEATTTNDNTLVYGSSDYTSINPALYEHGEINSLIFSGLTAHDAQNNVIPDLAQSWEFHDKTKEYTFHLRKGVVWQDGEPFTSDDVKFTLETILNPDNASEIVSNYEDIVAIETPDDQTVVLKLKDNNVAMLDYMTIGILPKHLLEGKDVTTDSFNQNPVGTGPYRLTKWETGQYIQLEKNDAYYGTEPKISTILFKIVPDEKVRAMQLKSGELDLAQISPKDAQGFEGKEGYTIYDCKTADYRGILYNFANPFFKKHREVVNALSYAIDRQAIVDTVLLGKGEVAYSPLQMGEYCNETIEKYTYEPERTKQLLEQSGWKLNDGVYEKDGDKLQFTITCPEGDPVRSDMAMICAQQFREVGADVKVEVKADIDWEGQDAYLIGWGSPFDPDDHTYKVFGTNQGANYSSYSNKKVDQFLLKARKTEDTTLRKQYYDAFQQELANDLPYTFLAYVDAMYVTNTSIKGIQKDTILGHHGVGLFFNVAEWEIEH